MQQLLFNLLASKQNLSHPTPNFMRILIISSLLLKFQFLIEDRFSQTVPHRHFAPICLTHYLLTAIITFFIWISLHIFSFQHQTHVLFSFTRPFERFSTFHDTSWMNAITMMLLEVIFFKKNLFSSSPGYAFLKKNFVLGPISNNRGTCATYHVFAQQLGLCPEHFCLGQRPFIWTEKLSLRRPSTTSLWFTLSN